MSQVDYSLLGYKRPKLTTPNGETKLLMHSCCAPCAGEIMEALVASSIDTTIFFYNPNIHPKEEYELRKEENIRFSKKLGMPFIDADYERDNWFDRTKGQEYALERGERCTTCFDMRFEVTAQYAQDHGFNLISSIVNFTISYGLSALEKRIGVILFTPLSVLCAESSTATNSVYGSL